MNNGAQTLRKLLEGKKTVVAPGVFSPSVAKLAERLGFKAVYFSGAAFSNLMGLPDLGVTTLTEVAGAVRSITNVTSLPLIADIDTGFGEALNVARTVKELKGSGAAAVQLEDQVLPKKCGHLDGKEVVDRDEMVKKLVAAKQAARKDMMIVARTDARAVEGFDEAVERARYYQRAGADIIFPEALTSRKELLEFRKKVPGPLLANMTEFGKTPYLPATEFEAMGYNIVIFPVTAFRAMMKSVDVTLRVLKEKGTQEPILDELMTRDQFNEIIGYSEYEKADRRATDAARRIRKARA